MFKRHRKSTSASPARTEVISTHKILSLIVDPSEANIDIVAIHGLNPLNNPTHAHSTWTANDKLWLRDFLPKRYTSARIFIYNYNANVAFGAATAGVREQAECLLDQIAKKRQSCVHRPIIFIAHSLGGIVVKRALVHAKSDPSYEDIWQSTFGLVFFGTPHRGGNRASLGDRIASLVRALAGSPNNTFMEALKAESLFLETLTDDFRQLLEQFRILSFYETRPLGRFGIVVDKSSATLGLPGIREKQIAMDADHRQICKFASEEDPRYQQVADSIIELMKDAVTARQKQAIAMLADKSGNISRIEGSKCFTSQLGKENLSHTFGVGNNTDQFGGNNSSEVRGEGNQTTQVEMEQTDALKAAERFLVENLWSRRTLE